MSDDNNVKSLDLEAIAGRATAATQGPWKACGANNGRCECGFVWSVPLDQRIGSCNGDSEQGAKGSPEDTVFVAHAREDVPALVAEVRRLRALLQAPARAQPKMVTYQSEADGSILAAVVGDDASTAPEA